MPELPEIVLRAREANAALTGRSIASVEVYQPKVLNVPVEEFSARLEGQVFGGAEYRGKWICCHLNRDWLLINLGMGGEFLLHAPDAPLPDKVQAALSLADGHRLSLHFWWFGYLHLAGQDGIDAHPMVGRLGADPLSSAFTEEALRALLAGRRTRVKNILLDQTQIAGIGNMYAHDILFRAGVHPLRVASELREPEVTALWQSIRQTLAEAIELGGFRYEVGLDGQGGRLDMNWMQVGYKEGQPCPRCDTPIEKIKTGSTASFVCPACQPA